MQLIRYHGERTLDEIVIRLYKPRDAVAGLRLKKARELLLRVNPHLADLSNVEEGTYIAVPEVHGLQQLEGLLPAENPWVEILSALLKQVQTLQPDIRAKTDKRMEGLRRTTEALNTPRLQLLAKDNPKFKQILSKAADSLENRKKAVEVSYDVQKTLLKNTEENLKEIHTRMKNWK